MSLPHAIARPIPGLPESLRLAWFTRDDRGYGIVADPARESYVGIWCTYGGAVAQAYRSDDQPATGVRELLRDGYHPADAPRILSPLDPTGAANLARIVTGVLRSGGRSEFPLHLPPDTLEVELPAEPAPRERPANGEATPYAPERQSPEALAIFEDAPFREALVGAVIEAARRTGTIGDDRGLSTIRLFTETNERNKIGTIFHNTISIEMQDRGLGTAVGYEGGHGVSDVNFGSRIRGSERLIKGEIKTARELKMGYSANDVYITTPDQSPRLLIGADYTLDEGSGATAPSLRVLGVRLGEVRPSEFSGSPFAFLPPSAYAAMIPIYLAPLEEWPASIVHGVGPKTLSKLGLGEFATVGELCAASPRHAAELTSYGALLGGITRYPLPRQLAAARRFDPALVS